MKLFTLLTAIAITSIALRTLTIRRNILSTQNNQAMQLITTGAKEAEALLMKVHKVYKNADAIIETVTVTMPAMMPGEEPEQNYTHFFN